MEPTNLRFGGGIGGTLLHPLVAVALLLALILVLTLPRRHIIFPLLLAIFFIPKGQVVVVAGAHFTIAKILFMGGLVRRAMSRQSSPRNSIDRVFALWAF